MIAARIFAAAAFAVALVTAAGPARADYLNLECSDTRQTEWNAEHKPGIIYWVDLDKQTITWVAILNGEFDPKTVQTHSVQITPEAFNFSVGQFTANVNRLTGDNYWNGPGGTQHYVCSKGARPFPTGLF